MAAKRGTSNANVRGNSATRRERREWLVQTYRADQDVWAIPYDDGAIIEWPYNDRLAADTRPGMGRREPACRCYRCGRLLTVDTVTADRIKPGCQGGRYRTPKQDAREGVTNIRPACSDCQSKVGGATRSSQQQGGIS